MSTQHIVSAAAAKVSIGAAGGNRVGVMLRRGDVVPQGVAQEQLERLVGRGLIQEVEVEEPAAEPAAEPAESETQEQVEIPEGDPSEEWTAKQLDAYSAAKGIDLGSGKNKAEKVAAIAAASA